jgi:hypothetical protein
MVSTVALRKSLFMSEEERSDGQTHVHTKSKQNKKKSTISTEDMLFMALLSPVSNNDTSIRQHFLST